ncbi:thioredoxin family protein [Lentibacillus saliphilus]|uniref:thioredoxin family protein n=1 Tax=Lentibacillus saliphilus TaxID=2737028 RepID=UPI001C30EC6F|nr:thioredoxin family protein [Lentibacillus saliphilus]
MKIIQSKDEFKTYINKDQVIALFTADWCPDCRVIEPELPEIEQHFPNYTFISIDRDAFIDVCQDYDIFGIPSFIAFRNGEDIGRFVSKDRKTKEQIISFIQSLS